MLDAKSPLLWRRHPVRVRERLRAFAEPWQWLLPDIWVPCTTAHCCKLNFPLHFQAFKCFYGSTKKSCRLSITFFFPPHQRFFRLKWKMVVCSLVPCPPIKFLSQKLLIEVAIFKSTNAYHIFEREKGSLEMFIQQMVLGISFCFCAGLITFFSSPQFHGWSRLLICNWVVRRAGITSVHRRGFWDGNIYRNVGGLHSWFCRNWEVCIQSSTLYVSYTVS